MNKIRKSELRELIRECLDESLKGDTFESDYYRIQEYVRDEWFSGQAHQTWKLVPKRSLMIVWNKFTKYGRVDEKEIEKIWDVLKESVIKLGINTSIHHDDELSDFIGKDNKEDVTEGEWRRWYHFISDLSNSKWVRNSAEYNIKGNARYSDASNNLLKLLTAGYSAKSPEELLMVCDRIINFIHGLGPMAKWFIEGGTQTLDQLSSIDIKGIHLTGKLSEVKKLDRSKNLLPLIKLASHYSTFKDFESDYVTKNFHGLYWHLTTDPNFKITPDKSPTDLSSLSSGSNREPGLMVTTDIKNWESVFQKTRLYVALIDLSNLIPDKDYRHVGRGFGHEIYVSNPMGARVIKVVPIQKAKRLNDYFYKYTLPQSSQELEKIYNAAHKKPLQESLFDSFEQYLTFGGRKESSYVEVFKNPNLSEFKECVSDSQVGAVLHEKDIYTWNRDMSYHSTIMNRLYKKGMDIKNTLPVMLYIVRGNEVEVMVTDASKFTKWHHNPNVAKFINHHPFFQFKKVINIIYYDQDIVGDWSEKSSMREGLEASQDELMELLQEVNDQLMDMWAVADDSVADYILTIEVAVKFIDKALRTGDRLDAFRALEKAHDVLEKEYDETPEDEEYDDLVDRIRRTIKKY